MSRRVETTFLEGIYANNVDLEETDYWFTEPEGRHRALLRTSPLSSQIHENGQAIVIYQACIRPPSPSTPTEFLFELLGGAPWAGSFDGGSCSNHSCCLKLRFPRRFSSWPKISLCPYTKSGSIVLPEPAPALSVSFCHHNHHNPLAFKFCTHPGLCILDLLGQASNRFLLYTITLESHNFWQATPCNPKVMRVSLHNTCTTSTKTSPFHTVCKSVLFIQVDGTAKI